jgi:hypothetical protein
MFSVLKAVLGLDRSFVNEYVISIDRGPNSEISEIGHPLLDIDTNQYMT